MAKQLHLQITTPERIVVDEFVDEVTVPTTAGEITILPDHIPLVSRLASGDVVAHTDKEPTPIAVVDGFVQIIPEKESGNEYTKVVLLADFAESIDELTDSVIENAKQEAEQLKEKMKNIPPEDIEFFETQLERNLIRARIGGKWKDKKYRKITLNQ